MKNKVNGIVLSMKEQINNGFFKPSEKLPSENALSIKYNCSRLTARKALQSLKEEELVVSRMGKGYYISAGNNKIVFTFKKGKEKITTQIHYGEFNFSEVEHKVFNNLKYPFKLNNSFDFYKTSYNAQSLANSVLKASINQDLSGPVDVKELQKPIITFFNDKGINIAKKIEQVVVIQPPQFIQIKLNIQKNQKVVASYAVFVNELNIVVMYWIKYTLLEKYVDTFERKY